MSFRTRIKMCGVTTLEDALAAVDAGVDALGFIFAAKSPRMISPEDARLIISNMPPFVNFVGVFVDHSLKEVEEIVEYCGLSHVQLHGSETPKFCERISRLASPCKVIKAFRVSDLSQAEEMLPYNDMVRGFLLDTYVQGEAGGTGKAFDWAIVERLKLQRPLILAGGLTPDNVGEAVFGIRPFAVDVNSGVEISPGVKDAAKLQEFIRQVNLADQADN